MKLDYKDTVYTEQLTQTERRKLQKRKAEAIIFYMGVGFFIMILWMVSHALADG